MNTSLNIAIKFFFLKMNKNYHKEYRIFLAFHKIASFKINKPLGLVLYVNFGGDLSYYFHFWVL